MEKWKHEIGEAENEVITILLKKSSTELGDYKSILMIGVTALA